MRTTQLPAFKTLTHLALLRHPHSWQISPPICLHLPAVSSSSVAKRAVGTLSFIDPNSYFQAYVQACCSILKSCPHQNSFSEGKSLHGHLIKLGISSERSIANKLLTMYLNCEKATEVDKIFREIDGGFNLFAWNCMISGYVRGGHLEEACRLFDEMPQRDAVSWTALITGFMTFGRVDDAIWYFERHPFKNVVSWTAMINGFARNGSNLNALMLFRRMLERGINPNDITFTCVISACASISDFRIGRSVLGLIIKTGFEHNLSVCNSLITFHLRMGEIDLASHIFDGMKEKDVVSWTAILDVYVGMGKLTEARRIFDEMPDKNEVSWSAMIARYSQNGDVDKALKLFKQMIHDGFKPNISCFSSVLSAFAGLEALQLGMHVHCYVIKTGIEDNIFIGSPLIDMYCKCGKTAEGRLVFHLISDRNIVTWNSMVAGYSYNGDIGEAKKVFGQMPVKNVVSWNALIAGYVHNEHCEEVLEVFDDMLLSGELPNQSTFSSILRACASLAFLEKGKNLHGKIVKLGVPYEVFMGTALTDVYAKSGDIESSKRVFDRMLEKNEISWTVMIQGLADNGYAEEALLQFEQMRRTEVSPTELTFLGVLFACCHCGLVEKGFQYFELMERDYGIKPVGRHYTCMVDLLARAGHLSEAEDFIKMMPFQPEANAWAALLSACSTYGNEEIGERTASRLWELEKENSAGYILLSNIYASARRWSDVAKVRRLMREKGLKKCGGCSWIQVRDQIHTFFVGDETHPQSAKIYGILELLMDEMIV